MAVTLLLLALVIAGVMLMLWAGVALVQDKRYFTSAPKDVQEAIQPRDERFRGARALGWILIAVAAALIVGAVVVAVVDGVRRGWGFGEFFLRFLVLLEGYKVWDMVFLDWFLLTKSRFYQHYYPEVEGCESLRRVGFNKKSQLVKLCIAFPLIALALAGACSLASAAL